MFSLAGIFALRTLNVGPEIPMVSLVHIRWLIDCDGLQEPSIVSRRCRKNKENINADVRLSSKACYTNYVHAWARAGARHAALTKLCGGGEEEKEEVTFYITEGQACKEASNTHVLPQGCTSGC